jgi:hypothetical protein
LCLAVLVGAGSTGLGAGLFARPTANTRPVVAEMAANDTINLRFPAEWSEASAAPLRAFASADGTLTLFNPEPTYPVAQQEGPPPVEQAAKSTAAVQVASAAPINLASVSSKPAAAPAKPVRRSNAVLNEAQIASIKRRLNLTPDQERYWPAVAAQLRKMEYKKDKSGQGTQTASVDMSKVDVEGLKSAGFPLVMSFSDDQRRELNSLTHLLGLENVMSGL